MISVYDLAFRTTMTSHGIRALSDKLYVVFSDCVVNKVPLEDCQLPESLREDIQTAIQALEDTIPMLKEMLRLSK